MNNKYALVITLAALGAGCSSAPSELDANFGETVTHVLTEQTYNPAASHSNSPRAVMVLDGEKAGGTLEGYRAAVPKEESSKNNVVKMKIVD